MKKISLFILTIFAASAINAQTDVTFFTTEGRFVVEIYDNIVPITGGNFLDLVDSNFYDGVIFHRVINNFMIQGGDPTGTGSGGPGYSIPDEFDSSLSNIQKTISMANSGPNTGGSQFFINLVNNTYLDFDKSPLTSKHPVFGMVTQNFSVVQAIGAVQTGANDRPIIDVVMDSIRRGSDLTVGLDPLNKNPFSARIYPNPVNSSSVLLINSEKHTTSNIVIFDALGKVVASRDIELKAGRNYLMLNSYMDLSTSKGIYHVNLMTEDHTESMNVIVK